jgi:hypothetical protein
MKVIFKKPNQKAEILNIKNDYKELQKLVSGHLDHVLIAKDVGIYVNDEGLINELEPNMVLWDNELNVVEVLVGNIVIVQHKAEYDVSLSEKNIEKYMKMLEDNGIIIE